jgi:tRNA 2-selenouridine synthase
MNIPRPATDVAASHALPNSLGTLAFTEYAMIIDARSPHEFAEDHIPGAVNWPVVDDDEFAQVGTRYKTDKEGALAFGAVLAQANMQRHDAQVQRVRDASSAPVLVYCFRGGKRSQAWADHLVTSGLPSERVHRLQGGWKRYRRWVMEQLDTLPSQFKFKVVSGATASGKTRMLAALQQVGEQVIDLEGLAEHRGSLLGDLPGKPQPTQKRFDSLLLESLSKLSNERAVWVESESKKIGRLQIPQSLCDAMRATVPFILEAPMHERVRLCREDYAHYARDPVAMVTQLEPLKPMVGQKTLDHWMQLAQTGQVDALFEALMVDHYDPCYLRTGNSTYARRDQAARIELPSLSEDALRQAAIKLASGSAVSV